MKPQLIKDATDIFTGHIDPDFKQFTRRAKKTKSRPITYKILTKNNTFKEMFNTETDVLTQEEIVEYCRNHKDQLGENSNFFLFKENNHFFVADAFVRYGEPRAYVDELSNDRVWHGDLRHRLVFPQLNPKTLKTQSLDTLDTLTRVKNLEKKIDKVVGLAEDIVRVLSEK